MLIAQSLLAAARRTQHLITRIGNAASWLVLPLVCLLFAQVPLREWVNAYNLQANDLAQLCHGVLVALAIPMTAQADGHLRFTLLRGRFSRRWQRWIEMISLLLLLAPWLVLMLIDAWPIAYQAVSLQERFLETRLPGYWLLKVMAWSMPALLLLWATARLIELGVSPEQAS